MALRRYQDARALEHAQKAHELDASNPVVAANLAVVYHYNGKYEERDAMTATAEEVGYDDVAGLQMIYDGEWTVRE